MAKVKFTIPPGVEKRVREVILGAIQEDSFLNEVGAVMQKDIQIKLNKGVNPETLQAFPPLKPASIENRKRLAKLNDTARGYSAAKSNITFTGQFIKSITYGIIQSGRQKIIEIYPRGTHRGYKTGPKSKSDDMENAELAKLLKAKGRNWFGVSEAVIKTIKVQIKSRLRRLLRQPIDK